MSASDSPKSAVYTVLLGGYEALNDQQNTGDHGVRFICFTDDETLTSPVWDIRPMTALFERDLQRSQREFKIRGCADLAEFERTLYIDNSVSLLATPESILDGWLAEHEIAIPLHSFRPTVLDEFLAVIEIGLDEPARVYEQLYHYSESNPEVLDERPLWNGLIARRNGPEVQQVMARWFDEVLRYSRRDQLSANVILGRSGIRLNRVELDNHVSALHQWPVPVGRPPAITRSAQTWVMPDLARIRELEIKLAQQFDRAELKQNELAGIQATRSWLLAKRMSALASVFRTPRRSSVKGVIKPDSGKR
jgi:hypothetical protein